MVVMELVNHQAGGIKPARNCAEGNSGTIKLVQA
jgi:hypothetical protein